MESKYYCHICSKQYSCRQSLYSHNKKFHPRPQPHFTIDNAISTPNNAISTPNNAISTPNNAISTPNKKKHICEYCNKRYTRIDIVTRHKKICKQKHKIVNKDNDLLKAQIQKEIEIEKENMKKEMERENKLLKMEIKQMKKDMMEMINKQYKIHPKTFQKFKDNNGVIINNIIPLGYENIVDVMGKDEQKNILGHKFQSIFKLIKVMHCGDQYPQFHNCAITSIKSHYAYTYDSEKKHFIIVDKNELVDDILEHRRSDIGDMLELHKDDLDIKTYEKVEKLFNALNDKPYYENKYKKDIKILLYNERHDIKALESFAQTPIAVDIL